jgi:hypothetical protein
VLVMRPIPPRATMQVRYADFKTSGGRMLAPERGDRATVSARGYAPRAYTIQD